ncbi:MAG TPA: chemotaxis protein CheW [candidate division Zixibacteria bacterium]|nr:chemotaxis protein CheW [candidate division Zixibacteria bacterium]
MTGSNKYVVFPLGKRRFAVAATQVTELASSGRPQTFPHTTPSLLGVLVRRSAVVAVCDVAPALNVVTRGENKFYLIAECTLGGKREPVAMPVTGECVLAEANVAPREERFGVGVLESQGEQITVLDLDALVGYCTARPPQQGTEISR